MANAKCGIEGIEIGNAQDDSAMTGCTVVLLPEKCVVSGESRGGAVTNRECAFMPPEMLLSSADAILMSGGSSFGLGAAEGVVKYLEEKGRGFQTPECMIPIVPAAVIYDLCVGNHLIRPDSSMGYNACLNASSEFRTGSVGAGTGATVGKFLGTERSTRSGMGYGEIEVFESRVSAIVVMNALGDVVDDEERIIAGLRAEERGLFISSEKTIISTIADLGWQQSNTILTCVITDAEMSKSDVLRLAKSANNGIARCVRPCNTIFDGDTVFSVSTNRKRTPVESIITAAPLAVSAAARNAVLSASAGGPLPSCSEWVQ